MPPGPLDLKRYSELKLFSLCEVHQIMKMVKILQTLNFYLTTVWSCFSLHQRAGGRAWRPPVGGPAEHRRGVPRRPLLHLGVSRSPRQPGPRGGLAGRSPGLDPGSPQADSQDSNHGREGEARPVSFVLEEITVFSIQWQTLTHFLSSLNKAPKCKQLIVRTLYKIPDGKSKLFKSSFTLLSWSFSSASPQVGLGLVSESWQKQRREDDFQRGEEAAEDDERGHERGACSAPLHGESRLSSDGEKTSPTTICFLLQSDISFIPTDGWQIGQRLFGNRAVRPLL